ncbi:uncharacterized protein LOC130827692 isoform X3 [Amaranthus tricolor]|uniref:uncharacterized protein LOC130827692 isoform X3 n=1 Tax=Amaranthus tricolor TaxID=29722 RepID=UPI00258A1F4D|nr:uncharacterized protein LOC130827692 isoform X3 [Amaranthus tricolor]XP_057549491.1 uncharacterized protein LOC130827692 isoform X3 [Amaranthus tricolor]
MAQDMELQVAPGSINASLIFHVVSDVLAFLLYMHQQIPSMLQDMTLQFDALQAEYKELAVLLTQNELNGKSRRKSIGRKREINLEIRRSEKLMSTISGLQTALELLIREVPNVEDIIFAFGANPRRPQHVYEISFSHGRMLPLVSEHITRNQTIEVISRKVIRALISKGVGTTSYTGPSKLFFLVKAPASFNMPLHFLPKRDFQFSKKIVPLRLRLRPRISHKEMETYDVPDAISVCNENHVSGDFTWFQCRYVIKGIVIRNPSPEE